MAVTTAAGLNTFGGNPLGSLESLVDLNYLLPLSTYRNRVMSRLLRFRVSSFVVVRGVENSNNVADDAS